MKTKKVNVKGALTALDMVHADLWLRLKQLEATESNSAIIKKLDIVALKLLVEAAMKDLGAL